MFKKIAFGLFLLFAALSIVYALRDNRDVTTPSDQAYADYQEGVKMLDKLYHRQACDYFEKAVVADSNFAMALARLSYCYEYLGFEKKAKETWERALAQKDKISEREQLILELHDAGIKGKDTLQLDLARKYVDRFPQDREGYFVLATAEMGKRNYEQAIEHFSKAAEVDPQYAMAYNMLGYLSHYLGRYDDALSYLQRYSELAPDQANPSDSKGEILHARGRYEEAIEAFRQAFNIQPDFDVAVLHMAESYDALGMSSKADYCYQLLIDQAPGETKKQSYYVSWAYGYLNRKEFDSAIARLNYVLNQDSNQISAAFGLCRIYWERGNKESLARTYSRFEGTIEGRLATEPTFKETPFYRLIMNWKNAASAEMEGNYEVALKHFAELVDQAENPTSKVATRRYYARAFWKNGQNDLAKSELQKNLSVNPNHAKSLLLLADIHESEGDGASALSYRQRALEVWKNADTNFIPLVELKTKLNQPIASASKKLASRP